CAVSATDRFGLRVDMTSNKLYALSDTTKEVLKALPEPVEIRVFSSKTDFVELVAQVLERYQVAGGEKIKLTYLDPYTNPTVVEGYLQRGYAVEVNSIVVEGSRYTRVLALSDLFKTDSTGETLESMKAEQQLTAAILYASSTQTPTVQFVEGHNEQPSEGLKNLFAQNNYEVSRVTLAVSEISAKTSLLVIAAPSDDFSAPEIKMLDTFMQRGGRMMLFLAPSATRLPNLETFLEEWGIGVTNTVVAEKLQYTDANPLSIVPIYAAHPINQYFTNNRIYPVMPSSCALEQLFVGQGNVTTAKVLYSSDRSYGSNTEPELPGPFTMAITSTKKLTQGEARLFVVGSKNIYSDDLLRMDNYGNADFLAQTVNWCTQTDTTVNIPAKALSDAPISVMAWQVLLFAGLLLLVLPLTVLGYGIFVYLRRRHL
ncbi:MAG: GldG family protein, partial [Ruthenibacterium sp.]